MVNLNRRIDNQRVEQPLTQREIEILRRIADGLSNDDVAGELFITLGTVKWYLKQIYSKLQVSSRTQAIAVARSSGLLDETPNHATLSGLHNLPNQSTPFIGRDKELATITRRLADPGCRLLTIVGPGGIGKTRLALQAAERQVTAFAQGIYFVSLAPLTSPDSIELALADAIGFSFYPGVAPRQQLLDYLRTRNVLLVLDNFEHLLAGVGLISAILEVAPRVKILATSRERLNLQAETLVSLDGLAYPARESADNVAEYSAVKLFLQRATQIQPDFPITAGSLSAVVRICRQVQGMPLGILLAATWVEALSMSDIAQEIQKSLDFLEIDQHDMPERQRSLRAAFNHSWNLLTEEERNAFKRLSVFRGSFTREAAQQVSGASLKVLMALVHKSLLRCDAVTGRHEIHELMRQFGMEQLDSYPQESEQIHGLHCEFYADYTRQQWTALMSLRQGAVLSEIGVEFNNIREAWNYAVEKCRAHIFREMAESLLYYSLLRTSTLEAWTLFGRAAEALQSLPLDQEIGSVLGLMLAFQGGNVQGRLLEPSRGKALIERGLDVLRQYDSPAETVYALVCLANTTSVAMRQFAEGEEAARQGLLLAQKHHLEWAAGWCLTLLGYCVWAQGDLVQARDIAEAGARVGHAFSDVHMMYFNAVHVLGRIAMDVGDYGEAEKQFERGLRWAKELEKPWGARVANACLCHGKLAFVMQDYGKAKYWLQQALDHHKQTGRRDREYNEALYEVSRLFTVLGKQDAAVEVLSLLQNIDYETPDQLFVRDLASASLCELRDSVPADIYTAALQRGKSLDFDVVVTEFLAG